MIQFVGRKCLEHGQGCGEQGWQGALGRLLEEVMCEPRLEGGEGGSHPDVRKNSRQREQREAWRVPGTTWRGGDYLQATES